MFFSALGFHVEPWPGNEDTTADVTLGCLNAPVIQLFKANDRHVPTRCALGFQVADMAEVARSLDRSGFGWECPGPNRLQTHDPDGNRIHVMALA
jgi:hypothetical protein